MRLPNELRIDAEQLSEGETLRRDCPTCGRKKTFTLTRKDGMTIWNCYSTHCSEKGALGGAREFLGRPRKVELPERLKPFTGDLRELSDEEKAYLAERVYFEDWHLSASGVRFAPGPNRYAYPIYSPTGARRGWVLRAYGDIGIQRKAITRLDREEPHLSWYTGAELSDHVLMVEDIPSAVRASRHYPGWVVAICGGGVGPDYVREIHTHANHVVWALDADATATAIRLHRTYGLVFSSSRVLELKKDLKDLDEDELKEVLSHVVS